MHLLVARAWEPAQRLGPAIALATGFDYESFQYCAVCFFVSYIICIVLREIVIVK